MLFPIFLRQDSHGEDVVGRATACLEDWQVLVENLTHLASDSVDIPAGITIAGMRQSFMEAKMFLCSCSAWDIMLGPPVESKRQRVADVEQFKRTVDFKCADSFPATLMKLLEAWQEGRDVCQLLAS